MVNFNDSYKKLKSSYRFALALTLFAIALFFRFTFLPLSSGGPFVTFYPAIIISFYFCGLFPGVVVAVLSGLAGAYYFLPPYNQLSLNFQIPSSIVFFSITSSLIGVLIATLHTRIEQLNVILDNEMVGSMMLKNRQIIWCNKAMTTISGYSRLQLIGTSTKQLFASESTFEDVGREAYPLQKDKPYRKQIEMRKADGSTLWADVSGGLVSYNASLSLWLVNDISKLKSLEEELKNQVNYDFLTGLHTRAWFMSQSEIELHRAVRYGSPLSLLMVDIDFFKRINDTYGHQVGDLAIKGFADMSRLALRESDICGRLGGEEFAILLPETNIDKALEVAERLRAAIQNAQISMSSGVPALKMTISIGVSTLISKEDSIDVLISKADKALYDAKNTGRNRVCSSS
ncbi:MAG: diguanylate cyclase [Pseudomonadota bacterium]